MITNHHPASLIGPRLAQSFEPIITQKEKNGNSIKITVLLWKMYCVLIEKRLGGCTACSGGCISF